VIQRAARVLAQARNPIAITRMIGKDPATVPHLVCLAETLNLPIFDGGATHMNFPYSHRLHQPGRAEPHIEQVDVILTLESDWPWAPGQHEPHPDATVISVGPDPLFSRYPLRSFQSDISLAGSAALTLQSLVEAVRGESLDMARIHERGLAWEAAHAKAGAALQAQAETGRTKRPLDKAWVSACVEQVRNDSTIIINELGLDVSQFRFERPGTYFGAPAPGILGWGLGAALGAKLAAPDKTVIACIGDGSYMFGAPTAAHWVARCLQLPVLFIVWNNARWNAVASATRGLYPDGWTAHLNSYPFSDLSPSMDWELVCQAAGGYGERIEDPAEVPAALARALRVVQQEQRQALLNMVAA